MLDSHDGYTIDLKHIHANDDDPVIEMGMDLSEFYLSVEWDIMAVPARRKVIFYRFVLFLVRLQIITSMVTVVASSPTST